MLIMTTNHQIIIYHISELPLNTVGMQHMDVPGTSVIYVACENFPPATSTTTLSGKCNKLMLM